MTRDGQLNGRVDTVPFWWEHGWREEMSFADWLDEWHAIKSPAAAVGHLDCVFECNNKGDRLLAARFLFHHMRSNLPPDAIRETWQQHPRAAVRIQRKAEEVFILKLLKRDAERDSSREIVGWMTILLLDADDRGTLFRDLLLYFEKHRYGSLDDETRHYLSVVRRTLLAAYQLKGGDFDRDAFCRLRETSLPELYTAMLAMGLDDVIDRCDAASLKALQGIVFKPYGFPEKSPEDLSVALAFGDKVRRLAAQRLMCLRAFAKARKRNTEREEVARKIKILEDRLQRGTQTVGVSKELTRRERARISVDLEILRKKARRLQAA